MINVYGIDWNVVIFGNIFLVYIGGLVVEYLDEVGRLVEIIID